MAEEASSVIMEISDEEGEQIGGGKRNYGRGDAARCLKQLSQKKYSKNANSMAISALKVKSVKPQHHLIKK